MSILSRLLIIVVAMSVAGCAWLPGRDKVAPNITETGVSPTSTREAVWLAAERPGLSAVGKDYLFVGPMTVNREGARRSYLWFAVGTTIDRRITGADKPQLDTIVLLVDGTPMTFDLVPWDNSADASPYSLAIDSYVSYAARVTSSQVRQLADASMLQAYLTDENGRSPVYSVVQGQASDWVSYGRTAAAAN